MEEEHMVLDFNDSKLIMRLSDVDSYNIDTIYDNIERFNRVVSSFKVNRDFVKIINSELFQVMLRGEATNNVDDLFRVYNNIASGTLIKDFKSTLISKNQFITNLRRMGFGIIHNRVVHRNGTIW